MKKNIIDLNALSEEELLKMRVCDLPLAIEGTWLESCIRELYAELRSRNILFVPPCYLADEWLTPDGEPVIGIPFFLAHPALMKLEKKMMLDVEGGTRPWCLKLLRHEAGHALNYLYSFYKRRKWVKIFGKFSAEYADTYRFRPYSRSFVRHLEDYYAQYHPDEDFAETFAVWLNPGSDWRNQYRGWKALDKLLYVDALMKQIGGKTPPAKKGKKYWEARRMRITVRNFYRKKKSAYEEEFPDYHDTNLKRIFSSSAHHAAAGKAVSADEVIKRYRKDIRNTVSRWTGERKYVINDLLDTLICRSRTLKCKVSGSETTLIMEVSAYVTTLIMNYLYTGRFGGDK